MPKPRPFSAKALYQAKLCAQATPTWLQRPTVFGIAIDSAATIEVDDAIWLEPLVPTGAAILWVHIADPTVWIPLDSLLDLEILSRCQTLYSSGQADLMMPSALSAHAISLAPDLTNTPKPALSVSMHIDPDGRISNIKLQQTLLTLGALRLSYPQADEVLIDALHPHFAIMRYFDAWAHKLAARRRRDGGFTGTPLGKLFADEDGNLVTMPFRSQQIVAEFMIAANTAVAHFLTQQGMNALFRNQAWSDGSTWQSAHDLELLTHRTDLLERACYGIDERGHASLRLAHYTHFTSPLRRAPDYVNHRIISALLHQQQTPYTSSQLQQLAEQFNLFAQQHSQVIDENARQVRLYQAERKARSQGLQQLDEKEFLRVLTAALSEAIDQPPHSNKVIASSAQSEEFDHDWLLEVLQETVRRLDAGLFLSTETFDKILDWASTPVAAILRPTMLSRLMKQPSLATMILNRRAGSKSIDYAEISNAGVPQFHAWAILLGKTTQHPGIDSTRQGAKNAACSAWCRGYLEDSLIFKEELSTADYAQVSKDVTSNQLSQALTDASPSENFIGAVNEWCQKQGIASPDYTDCTPTPSGFVCRVCLEWQEGKFYGEGSGKNKQLAKQKAAANLLSMLPRTLES